MGTLVFPVGRPHGLRAAMGLVAERGGAWQSAHGGIVDAWIEVDPIPAGHAVDAEIDPHDDHRVAMSFAVLGLRTGGIRIANPGCVAKSYPQFWLALERCEQGGR